MSHFLILRYRVFCVLLFWLIWCSPSFAQVETLADQEHRQEIRTSLFIPCLEKTGRLTKKAMNLDEQQVTGVELLRVFVPSNKLEELEKLMIEKSLEHTKGMPKNERMVWYTVVTQVCVEAFKERIFKNDKFSKIFPGMAQSPQSSKPQVEQNFSLPETPSHSSESVSHSAKQQAVKTCKESLQVLGQIPYYILNTCIEQELKAYQKFQQSYGE